MMERLKAALTNRSALSTLSGNNIKDFDRLVRSGFDINSDLSGSMPIHEICRYGYKEFLIYLIDQGADVNITDWDDRTPSKICLENDNWECFKILVARGALYGIEIKAWIGTDGDNNPEVREVISKLISRLLWDRRKYLIYCYSQQKINLPLNIFREIINYL